MISSLTLLGRDPNAACDLLGACGREGLLVLALGLLLGQGSPGERGLEHASRANVAVAAAALSTSLVQCLRVAGESSSYHQEVGHRVSVGARHENFGAREILGQGYAQVRIVEQATVLRLCRAGKACDACLRSEVGLAQATPLDEDLDCKALSALSRDEGNAQCAVTY